jgi:hypothetical protein
MPAGRRWELGPAADEEPTLEAREAGAPGTTRDVVELLREGKPR